MSEYIIDWDENLVIDTFSKNSLREEIVRCRDCVHAEPEREPPRKGCEGLLWCDYLTEGIGFSVLPHNFCAWGVRKEGGE